MKVTMVKEKIFSHLGARLLRRCTSMDVEVPPAWGVGGFTPIFPSEIEFRGYRPSPPQKKRLVCRCAPREEGNINSIYNAKLIFCIVPAKCEQHRCSQVA